jgi:hypothetical protein
MKMRKTKTETLAIAMDVLAREIQSSDGVANAAIAEAADRLRELAADLESMDAVMSDIAKELPDGFIAKRIKELKKRMAAMPNAAR